MKRTDCKRRSSLLSDAPSGTALWRSGYAADCKSVYAGSIPAGASSLYRQPLQSRHTPDRARRSGDARPRPQIHDFRVVNATPQIYGRSFANRLQPVNQFGGMCSCLLLETPTITQRLGGSFAPAFFLRISASFYDSAACWGLNRISGLLFTRLRLFRDSSVGRAGDC